MHPNHRLTLIACPDHCGALDWNENAHSRLVFVDNGPQLLLAMSAALTEPTLDTERVIIDRAASAEMFLQLLSVLPQEFAGDVLRIDDRGCGYLSVTGRGGDRLLYALAPRDVRFYLNTHGLERCDESDVLEVSA